MKDYLIIWTKKEWKGLNRETIIKAKDKFGAISKWKNLNKNNKILINCDEAYK